MFYYLKFVENKKYSKHDIRQKIYCIMSVRFEVLINHCKLVANTIKFIQFHKKKTFFFLFSICLPFFNIIINPKINPTTFALCYLIFSHFLSLKKMSTLLIRLQFKSNTLALNITGFFFIFQRI